MPKFEVEFYEKMNGEQPAKEFLLGLDKKMRAKMVDTITILQDNGYELREPYSKHLSEGIFELRAKHNKSLVLFLCGSAYNTYEWFYQKNAENATCRN